MLDHIQETDTSKLTIPRPKQTSPAFLIALAVLLFSLSTLAHFVIFPRPDQWFKPGWRLQELTHGLFNLTLTLNLVWMGIVVVLGLVVIGRQSAHDLGLDLRRLPFGVAVTVVLALVAWTLFSLVGLWQNQTLVWNPAWRGGHWPKALGLWLGQLFGNALYEEIVYRGFLIGQVDLLASRWVRDRPRLRLTVALLVSQAVFALIHVPGDYVHGQLMMLPFQFLAGLMLAAVYLWTRNLWIAIGVHTLINNPPGPLSLGW